MPFEAAFCNASVPAHYHEQQGHLIAIVGEYIGCDWELVPLIILFVRSRNKSNSLLRSQGNAQVANIASMVGGYK